jgi:GTP-binding protein
VRSLKVNSVDLVISAVRRSQYPTDEKSEYLLVGRSNVGKSSFINTLINRKNFARTSATPGKTQTINFYLVNEDFYLVDAPGYGFAALSRAKQKKFGLMMEDYLQNRPNLKQVFMLVDFRHKPSKDDIMMYNFLKHYKIPVTIVATKTDKVGITSHQKQRNLILNDLDLVVGDDFIMFSNVTKLGKNEVCEKIDRTK